MDIKIIKAIEIAFDVDLSNKKLSDCTSAQIESWDSLSFLNLVLTLEEEFGISFDPEEIAEMTSGGEQILETIEKKLA